MAKRYCNRIDTGMWYSAEGNQIWACGTLPNKTIEYRFVRGGRHAFAEGNQMWACGTLPNKTIKYRFVRGGRHAFAEGNQIWACGGMVDTLVLGTSANAWEFESLHAHFLIFVTLNLFQGLKNFV